MQSITKPVTNTPLRDRWARFTTAFERWFEAEARRRSRRDRVEALEAKSDAELARLGIRRDQIAYHVFNDLYYS